MPILPGEVNLWQSPGRCLRKATQRWSLWQALLQPFAWCFTHAGFRRFVPWVTGLVLNSEEHTIPQSLIGLDRTQDWRKVESFAEYGSWHPRRLERTLAQQLIDAPGHTWHGYHLWAGDDTKVHRSSKNVWGTCTFHEYTARCPNRAQTVRAHNGVVLGALLHQPNQPAHFLPVAGRLYFRQSQLPEAGGGPPLVFRTKNELLVEMARDQAPPCRASMCWRPMAPSRSPRCCGRWPVPRARNHASMW